MLEVSGIPAVPASLHEILTLRAFSAFFSFFSGLSEGGSLNAPCQMSLLLHS
jgi:hypothetical protein